MKKKTPAGHNQVSIPVKLPCPLCASDRRTAIAGMVAADGVDHAYDLSRREYIATLNPENWALGLDIIAIAFDCPAGHRYILTVKVDRKLNAQVFVEYAA